MSSTYDPSQQYLFDRRYQLEIIPFGQRSGAVFGNIENNAAVIRVQFELERGLASAADKGKINVYNLTAETRNAITRGCTVRLTAGYRGRTGLLFVGYVRKVQTNQAGPDVVTSLECGDGEPMLTYAPVNRSYAATVTLAQVLLDISNDLTLPLGDQNVAIAPGVIKGIPNKTFAPGLVVFGTGKQQLDRFLKPVKMDWSVQNGRLIILPREGTVYLSAVVLSTQTGMINTPGFNEKYLTVDSLMNVQLVPGAYVQVVSSNRIVAGFYKLRSCKYQGDTHDAPWQVSCEGEVVKEPLPFIPTAVGSNFYQAVAT